MIPADFESLLRRTIGLDPASIGSEAIARAADQRRVACGLANLAAYWEHVSASEAELRELIETVVVPETWFNRDQEAFAAMAQAALAEVGRRPPGNPLRLLSLPCATGEEPYSMAMALFDAGLSGDRFRIDAIDVSERALAKARWGVFGRNSFRGGDLGFRDRFFLKESAGYRLTEAVCRQVRFHRANLMDPAFLPNSGVYDVVFCRNLLIYLDQAAQIRAVEILRRILADSGRLFVGPSEAALLLSQGFVSTRQPRAFAFSHPSTKPIRAPEVGLPAKLPGVAPAEPARWGQRVPPAVLSVRSGPAPRAPVAADPDAELKSAERLADQGDFARAQALCEEHLGRSGPSARAYCLLGLVREAAGDLSAAAEAYRKALYLDPRHRETLAHYALLLERKGETDGAQILYRRLSKAGADVP